MSEYSIHLRTLPGYQVGDAIRVHDVNLCSYEATSYAIDKLRPNDCAFVSRSDGSFTYALYRGLSGNNCMSFSVSERGHFKVLSIQHVFKYVKVPVLTLPSDVYVSDAMSIYTCSSDGSTRSAESVIDKKKRDWVVSDWNSLISNSSTSSAASSSVHVSFATVENVNLGYPVYKPGMDVYYKKHDKYEPARIVEIHMDDLLEPYYTIKLEDGLSNKHITLERPPTATTSAYKSGMNVYFRRQNEKPVPARVIKVHLDDLLEPYYTIRLRDGQEKQAGDSHLSRRW